MQFVNFKDQGGEDIVININKVLQVKRLQKKFATILLEDGIRVNTQQTLDEVHQILNMASAN